MAPLSFAILISVPTEIHNLDIRNNLNIFHSNVNGLESKFDDLHHFLSGTSLEFDFVAISETSQQCDSYFINNVSLNGYTSFFTPTSTRKGGIALYVKSLYKPFEQVDLKHQSESCESVFVEISNKRSKNVICGSIYRHPCNDTSDFLSYMEYILKILASEDKDVFLCGDFNINLLKSNESANNSRFYDLMTSYSFLPLIYTRLVLLNINNHH